MCIRDRSNIKIFTMPNGGSVTLLSMLPFVLVSFRHGVKWGLFTGLVNGCLQMLLGFWAPPTPTFLYFLGEILLDYLCLLYTSQGLPSIGEVAMRSIDGEVFSFFCKTPCKLPRDAV